MNENQHSLKNPAKVALAALAVLLVGAIVFYKERVFFGDASFITFNVINYQRFYIQEHRFGSFITQMVIYFGQKMHVPIRAILVGYSVSFNLFYFTVASLLVYRYKQYMLAILMALYYFLFVTDSYFWTNNEIHQAIAWMCLLFGAATYLKRKHTNTITLVVAFTMLAFITVFTHFVVIRPVVFLWVYFLIQKQTWSFSKGTSILLSVILLLAIAVKFVFSINQPYDGSLLHGATHFSIKDVVRSFGTPVVRMFAYRCVTLYWPAIILFLLGIVALVKTKQNKLLAWTLVSAGGYLILMGLTYGGYESSFELFHVESEWAPITFIIAAPFAYSFLPRLRPMYTLVLLSSVFIVKIAYIGMSLPKFTWRNEFKEQVFTQMKKKNITKLALYNDKMIQSKLMLDWSLPNECILMSAMAGDQPQLTFRFVNPEDTAALHALSKPNSISISFDMLVPGNLNSDYYNIDTTRPYTVMSYGELLK